MNTCENCRFIECCTKIKTSVCKDFYRATKTESIHNNQFIWYFWEEDTSMDVTLNIAPFVQIKINYHPYKNSFSAGFNLLTVDPEYYIDHRGNKQYIKHRHYGAEGTMYYSFDIAGKWHQIMCDPG